MKNNPILQIVKMLLGAVASYKAITLLFEAKNIQRRLYVQYQKDVAFNG